MRIFSGLYFMPKTKEAKPDVPAPNSRTDVILLYF